MWDKDINYCGEKLLVIVKPIRKGNEKTHSNLTVEYSRKKVAVGRCSIAAQQIYSMKCVMQVKAILTTKFTFRPRSYSSLMSQSGPNLSFLLILIY